MSTDPFTEVDPFEAKVLDEQTELRAMTRALSFAEGFGLIFARCNQPDLRERLISEIKKELPDIKVREIHFTEPVPHLLDALREQLVDDSFDAIFVSGLEYSLPVAAEAHLTPFVANLNASRNSFPDAIRRPLVLWVPEYVLTAITRGAPDFFSIRSGVYSFAATPDETMGLAGSLLSGGEMSAMDLNHEEKRERIAAIESLLTDYEALPAARRNLFAEQNLRLRLGNILSSIGEYSAAQQYYDRILETARATANKSFEADAFMGLGNIKFEQRQLDQASLLYKASLDIYRQTDYPIGEAGGLLNLGRVYAQQGEYAEAESFLEKALDLFRSLQIRIYEATTLNNLAALYIREGKLSESEEFLHQALKISQDEGSIGIEADSLYSLGIVHAMNSKVMEAKASLGKALDIFRKIGARDFEGYALRYLSLIEEFNGNLEEAIKLSQESVNVLEKTEDSLALSVARKRLEELKNKDINHGDAL